jgi:TonB-like protein
MSADSSSPISVLKQAIKSVPAVKYALGIAGVIAVIAIIQGFKIDFRIAVFGGVIMFLLMTLLLIFANLAVEQKGIFHLPALVFMWFSLVLVMATALALFCSVFYGKPVDLRRLIVQREVSQQAIQIPATITVLPAPKRISRKSSDQLPLLTQMGSFKMPPEARQSGTYGRVTMEVLITEDGVVAGAAGRSGPKPLQQAAIDGMLECKFKPFEDGGERVEVSSIISVVFPASGPIRLE